MVALLKQQKIVTKDGECIVKIELDLNIKLDADSLQINVDGQPGVVGQSKVKQEDEDIDYVIPSFKKKDKKFKFGKPAE